MTNNTHVGHVGSTLERQEGEGGGRLLPEQGEINSVIFENCKNRKKPTIFVCNRSEIRYLICSLTFFSPRCFPADSDSFTD